MIQQYQRKAQEEGCSIWLEATTLNSRAVYAKLGFEVVGEYRLGEGTHSDIGHDEEGGAGVPVWGMLWSPEGKAEDAQ